MNTSLPPIAMLTQLSQCKQLVSISKREYIHYSSKIVSQSFFSNPCTVCTWAVGSRQTDIYGGVLVKLLTCTSFRQ